MNVNNQTKRRTTTRRKTQKKHSGFSAILARNPRTAWWMGGIAVICLYVWLFYSFFVSPTGFRWRALFGDPNYPAGYEIHGIDISHYQGEIDWDLLRNGMIEGCPLRFIMIKSTEGSTRLDDRFADNFQQAREYGYIRGAYHFGATNRLHALRLITFLRMYILRMATFRLFWMLSTSLLTLLSRIFNAISLLGFTL